MLKVSFLRKLLKVSLVGLAICSQSHGVSAAVPVPDRLLTDDTIAVLTVPDARKLTSAWKDSGQAKLLNDPAMKPFVGQFYTKWNERFAKPLERELGIPLEDFWGLCRGQLTLAIAQGHDPGESSAVLDVLLLMDSGEKSEQLRTRLAMMRQKWKASGRASQTRKIQGTEFAVLSAGVTNLPAPLKGILRKTGENGEPPKDNSPQSVPAGGDLLVGQTGSLLIVANSEKAIEKVMVQMSEGSGHVLADLAAYKAASTNLFRDAQLLGWVNARRVWELIAATPNSKEDTTDGAGALNLPREKILGALGFGSIDTLAFSFQQSAAGTTLQFAAGVPGTNRNGLVRILAGEPKEAAIPAFVPADTLKFRRWRIDVRKSWAELEKTLTDLSPQFSSVVNFVLDSADTYARQKEPGFEIRKSLLGNLGDDIVSYEKANRPGGAEESGATSTLFLVGSPSPDELAGSLKSILVFLSAQASTPPEEREILGRRTFSIPLGNSLFGFGAKGTPETPPTLHYAASGGYVALSTDSAMVEAYLRASQNQTNSLRDRPSVKEAAMMVGASGCSLFGYENQADRMRILFEALKSGQSASSSLGLPGTAALLPRVGWIAAPVAALEGTVDFSLLPGYESVAKYFSFVVYGGSANADALSLKIFAPNPTGTR